jgi:hypothetical protein
MDGETLETKIMGKFLSTEKPKQAAFKASASYFSEAARGDGIYR